MNDVPYLLRGITPVSTESSTLISSSKYLNDPRLRQWIADITLKQNGPDMPAQAEMYPLIGLLDELQDKQRIEELFTAERALNPALDAWFNDWFISDYDAGYFERFEAGTLGRLFYDEVIAKNPEKVAQIAAKPAMLGWFVGQVMKATGGKANPQSVNEIVKRKLGID